MRYTCRVACMFVFIPSPQQTKTELRFAFVIGEAKKNQILLLRK